MPEQEHQHVMTGTSGDRRRHLLVIDDEEPICRAFRLFFEARNWSVTVAATGHEGLSKAAENPPDLIFLDVRLPDGNGLQFMAKLREQRPQTPVVVITAYGGMHTVLSAVQGGAFDYLPKPIDLDRALELADRATESVLHPAEAETAPASLFETGKGSIIGSSKPMQEVFKKIAHLARLDGTTLILGQTGTGKELVAQAIHQHGPRKDGPFVAVNCSALPGDLVESELFGCVQGAFTGATADRQGRFEAADRGTLLLDEVGELPTTAQAKLLRVLDSRVIERVGSTQSIPLDVRILAATNRDLTDDVRSGKFRSDLYYRISTFQIVLPPLAERKEDILSLARYFLQSNRPPDTEPPVLSSAAARTLLAYSWPGNVRELKNAMAHAAAMAPSAIIRPEDLPPSLGQELHGPNPDQFAETLEHYLACRAPEGQWYRSLIEPVERLVIERALRECGGNQSRAAELLGLHRNTLRAKIRELGIKLQ